MCWSSGGKKQNTMAGVEGPCFGTRRNENEKIGESGVGDEEKILNMVPGRGLHSFIHSFINSSLRVHCIWENVFRIAVKYLCKNSFRKAVTCGHDVEVRS